MAFGFIKSAQAVASSTTSLNITVTSVKVGYLVIVNMKFTSAVSGGLSVTDNASTPNTYAMSKGPIVVPSSTINLYQFYGVAVTGGATTITVSWTGTNTLRATADQFSGGKLTNAAVFDKAASNTGTGTSASLTLSPTNGKELISVGVAFNAAVSSLTPGTNYLMGTSSSSTSTEYRTVGTTSETSPMSWTTSTGWAEIAGAYLARSNGGNALEIF